MWYDFAEMYGRELIDLSTQGKRVIIYLLLLSTALALTSCGGSNNPRPISETRLLLDTVCTVTLYDPPDRAMLEEALDLCAEFEEMFSRTIEGSDVWRINHAGGAPVAVSGHTIDIIRSALEFGSFSGGCFDITIGRLCALWDFSGDPAVPSVNALAEARATVGFRGVNIDGGTVRLENPQTWLDLGGIAKGYIADRLADFLRGRGVKSALIDLGGNIVTVGMKHGGEPWRIGVNDPFGGRSAIIGSIGVGEASLVTSGIYERQFTEDGVTYHHIIDPETGMPAESDVASVTIVSEISFIGDALSTIAILLGSEKTLEFLASFPGVMGAVLVLRSGEIVQFGDIDFAAA